MTPYVEPGTDTWMRYLVRESPLLLAPGCVDQDPRPPKAIAPTHLGAMSIFAPGCASFGLGGKTVCPPMPSFYKIPI